MMKKHSLLYYSNALIANHGGKLHSEAFLKEVNKNNEFEIDSIPKPVTSINSKGQTFFNLKRKLLKENSLLQILFFYRRNKKSWEFIKKELEENKYDFIHIRVDSNFLIIKKIKKHFPELKISLEINSSPFDENFSNIAFSKKFRKMETAAYEQSDCNFFISGNLRNRIMNIKDSNRDLVLHNGVDTEIFNNFQVKEEMSTPIKLVYLGTLDFHKNLNILIDAIADLKFREERDFKLIIIGDGPMRDDLQLYIEQKKLKHDVEILGWIQHEEIPMHLKDIDIAIHHSANVYMSPLKIFEYMAAGLPVIGPKTDAVSEIFDNETDLLLVECNYKDLSNKLFMLINDDTMRINLAKNGQKKVLESYTWKTNADFVLRNLKTLKR